MIALCLSLRRTSKEKLAKIRIRSSFGLLLPYRLQPLLCLNFLAKLSVGLDVFFTCVSIYTIILGCCLRTGVRISIRLPAFTWKPLVQDEVTAADLSSIDHQTSMVLHLVRSLDSDLFADMIDETFSTPLSDRSIALLRPGGDKQRVTLADRDEYVQLVHNARVNEAKPQINAIRRGINKVIPVQLLNILLHNELELLVNGRENVDIELLRRHTRKSAA
uniref:HECT domain-containing protein n=1 Tax=Spongospora subterranea TaxID=70186 RepID=A0A0H5RDA1_9EUKA|eukprot:CRZ11572.1 hypothetical protein [Spongospora subterranea]